MADNKSTVKTDANPSCRFYVDVGGKKQALFTEVSGLGVEMEVEEVREGGNNNFVHRLPGPCKTGTLVLHGGLLSSSEFFKWMMDAAHGKIERRNISVILYDPQGKEQARWNFNNAFPVKWTGPQFKAHDATVAIEALEIAHEGLKTD